MYVFICIYICIYCTYMCLYTYIYIHVNIIPKARLARSENFKQQHMSLNPKPLNPQTYNLNPDKFNKEDPKLLEPSMHGTVA